MLTLYDFLNTRMPKLIWGTDKYIVIVSLGGGIIFVEL